MSFRPRPDHPYAHAPRLPEGEEVPLDAVIPGPGPFELEIGPGRGGFIWERAAAAPESRILGIEIRLKWATLVDERLGKMGLHPRARVVNGDARVELGRMRPEASVARAFLHFPDPWWKKKHHKRLVVGEDLLDGLSRLLVDGGELFVQTDVQDRAALYEATLSAHPLLLPSGDAPGSPWLAENPYGARSPREHRAVADGLPVHRLLYRRRPR